MLIENIGIKRYEHSLRVVDTAIKLGEIYHANINKVKTAALLHDCAKLQDEKTLLKRIYDFDIILDNVVKSNKELMHGPLGSKIAEIENVVKNYLSEGTKMMDILLIPAIV